MFATPVTWDETRALAAKVGQYVAVAKRSGDKWHIGAIANDKAHEVEVTLDFLPEGEFQMTAFEDGVNADRQAMDYNIRKQTVRKGDKINIKMVRNGGFAALIERL
jgi:alpha-glucosidase